LNTDFDFVTSVGQNFEDSHRLHTSH